MTSIKIFSGKASQALAKKIADNYGDKIHDTEIKVFSDGEIQPIINESIRGSHCFFIQSTYPPAENILELFLLLDLARRASAGYITAVIPYFGYARQDRKDKPRVPISAKLMADLLVASGANRVMTMDFHADQIQGFFNIPVDHLQSDAIFIPYLKSLDLSNTIFASPDVGSVKRARTYSKHFNTDLVICDKQRSRANHIDKITVIGDVLGKDVILIDDLCDTAGTLCRAAEEMKIKGAKSIKAIITHPVLSGQAYDNIDNSVIDEMIVTDTIPLRKISQKIKVLSCSEIFASAIRNTHEYKSIAALFHR